MKELCEYSKQKKLARKAQHLELIKIYGECKGMGNRWYKSPQKSFILVTTILVELL